ncbi:hypothetical protein, partial [Escherichia coli]|uniref:hypothetical protein n=1 Tax=Escherichia coli TaxID=562 RepID=UPI002B2429B4
GLGGWEMCRIRARGCKGEDLWGKKKSPQKTPTSTDQQSRAEIRWKYPKIELADGVTDISQ